MELDSERITAAVAGYIEGRSEDCYEGKGYGQVRRSHKYGHNDQYGHNSY
jgi:hypothetical protein